MIAQKISDKVMKKNIIILSALAALAAGKATAQSGTNSPYSGYGLGKIADQSIGRSRGMNGVGVAFRESGHVNYLNPASYSAIDSLTFIFDIGMSLQNTNFKENGKSRNAKNGDFEYAVGSFRALRHLGMAFGLMPYTNVGYNYTQTQTIEGYVQAPSAEANTTLTNSFSGSGGLHQLFVGAGWEPVRGLSVGVNMNYLFGSINNTATSTPSDAYSRVFTKNYSTEVNSIRLDFGASYTMQMKNNNRVTMALTYSPGYKLGADSYCDVITKNAQSGVIDTTVFVAEKAMAIPTQWAVGLAYGHGTKWNVGMDYTCQRWSKIAQVAYRGDGTQVGSTDQYNDRHKIAVGAEYCKNSQSLKFADRMRYRIGMGYSSSYLKINGNDGPSEVSISAGLGVPIRNGYNSRSVVNVALQWSRASAKNLMTENTFLINIGLTFNEKWFEKWKFD